VDLSELIAATRGERTQGDLAKDAGMSLQNMQQYVAGGYPKTNFPDAKTLAGLARACRVDVWTVIKATAETLGIRTGADESKLVALLPPESAYLTDEAIAAIRTLIITSGRPVMEAAQEADAARAAKKTPGPRKSR